MFADLVITIAAKIIITMIVIIKDINEISYYIDISLNQNLSRNKLRERIRSKEYQRLSDETKTIGIIVCRRDDKYLIEYSSDDRIRITTYELV